MSTLVPFCKMKISRSSRTTAKKPTETHSPLILVRLILCSGSGGAVCGGTADAGPPGVSSPVAVPGWGLPASVTGLVGCGSVVI